jgi:hypothetical protein
MSTLATTLPSHPVLSEDLAGKNILTDAELTPALVEWRRSDARLVARHMAAPRPQRHRTTKRGASDEGSSLLWLDLHEDALRRGADVADQLVGRLLPALHAKLRRAFPLVDDDIRTEGVEDALFAYILHPEKFDPGRGVPLDRFLYVASWRNVADRLKAERRRRQREAEYARLVAWSKTPTHAGARMDVDSCLAAYNRRVRSARARAFAMVDNPLEAEALRRWLDGETRWQPLAAVLGKQHLPPLEQRRAVKRFKDRFMRRLTRAHTAAERPKS